MAAPPRVPKLNHAWNDESTGRPRRRSTATPCAFMDTSSAPVTTPYTNSARTSVTRSGASRGGTSVRGLSSARGRVRARLPYRVMRFPVRGMETRLPIAMASSTRPSTRGSRRSASRTVGTCSTQEAKTKPLPKKIADVAQRARRALPVGTGVDSVRCMVGPRRLKRFS